MISLPIDNQRWPMFRILTRTSWGGSVASGDGGWAKETMLSPGPSRSGFILINYTRSLLPQIGTCEFVFRYGVFGGQLIGASAETSARMRQGTPYDPEIDQLDIPDLTGCEIRIQATYPDVDGNPGTWSTVWWGTCEYHTDDGWGGATLPSGDRTYHCLDAFARTRRWFMDRHGFISSAGTIAPAAGHPGYNVSKLTPAQVVGNKDSADGFWVPYPGDGVNVSKFTMSGAGNPWTDMNVMFEAIAGHRPPGQPCWLLSGATDLFASASPWKVEEGDTVFDVVTRICNRARGRGAVLPGWTESDPEGPLTCTLLAYAQILDDVTYQDPAASSVTIQGATNRHTVVDVDVIGDHRFQPQSLILGDPEQYRVDYLVSQGEQIEVLGTVEHGLSLEPGWTTAEQTAFLALDADKRLSERWRPVFQLHRLIRGFQMQLGNGNLRPTLDNADYRCKDDGTITTEMQPNAIGNSAPSTIEVLDDLPLYEGYSYVGTPAREDGQTAAVFSGTPARKDPMMFVRKASDRYVRHDAFSFSVQLKIKPDGLLISSSGDQDAGTRKIGKESESGLGSVYDYGKIILTLGFRLPHRMRMATGTPYGSRRMVINHSDLHLWLASPGAIWDLTDTAPNSDGCPGKRNAGGVTPGILRDDRSALARMHALAVAWYRPRIAGHPVAEIRNASWSIRCCGDIPSTEDYDGGGVVYPSCGQMVGDLFANGETHAVNTVVSSIAYDNTNGSTTWTTDWQDLDFTHAR